MHHRYLVVATSLAAVLVSLLWLPDFSMIPGLVRACIYGAFAYPIARLACHAFGGDSGFPLQAGCPYFGLVAGGATLGSYTYCHRNDCSPIDPIRYFGYYARVKFSRGKNERRVS